ncbi:MAG TPA: MarC family protein [Methanospirillum sp.]|uniref:MarC family protein n=1 Tax=Methanospirillum sp. TaxID=45200 RepID=UPI002B6681A8|nr:MarC family protein [Methanospirillum sp.]HWQ63190.1 MarC family protein [Methanospirillum sp.]
MTDDLISLTLFTLSSILIVVDPIGAMLVYHSLTGHMEPQNRKKVAVSACRLSTVVLLFFTIFGSSLLSLFGITIEAFTIAGGVLLFGIGMEIVYAKTSRAKMTEAEKHESYEAEEISSMPLAFPMIAGPGTITTVIVLSKNVSLISEPVRLAIILGSVLITMTFTYLLLVSSEQFTSRIGQREYRVVSRLMGILLMAIAVQFLINGISTAFPSLIR